MNFASGNGCQKNDISHISSHDDKDIELGEESTFYIVCNFLCLQATLPAIFSVKVLRKSSKKSPAMLSKESLQMKRKRRKLKNSCQSQQRQSFSK